DHFGLVAVADLADRLEQVARAVQVDAVALLEIRFRLPRYHRREVEDEVRPLGYELFGLAGGGQVGDDSALEGHHVLLDELADALLPQLRHEFTADHAGRADDQNTIHGARL